MKTYISLISIIFTIFFVAESAYAVITIGGVDFDDNAFADTVISTDYNGGFDSSSGYVPEGGTLDLEESITGYNLQTWIDYGIPGPGIAEEDYVRNPSEYFQLGFTDNSIVNGEGYDLVIFQQGGDNGVYVSIDNNFEVSTSVVVTSSQTGELMHMCFVDLSDLGVADGASVDRISLSTYVAEGDVYPYGVPEIAGAAALHSGAAISPGNQAPVVDAGVDQTVYTPNNIVTLTGTATDDGLPEGSSLEIIWSQVSGPATAVISDYTSVSTQVTLSATGIYEFELMADDSELYTTDTVIITYVVPDTEAPTVPTTLTATAVSGNRINLTWDAATDNVAVTGYNIYRDSVLIDTVTGTSYSDTGLTPLAIYTYTVSAFDAASNASDQSAEAQAETLEYIEVVQVSHSVATGNDDAEELSSGSVVLNSSDLELSTDLTEQTIGVRFSTVNIPYGAQIVDAYIEFTTDEVTTGATSLVISIEDTSDAAAYEATDSNLSSRVVSATTVAWTDVETWDSVGSTHATPDLSALLQEAVVQPGWAAGNAVSFIITGTGTRTAESYEGSAAGAPRLVVSYTVAPDTSAPSVPANLTATPTSGSTIDLTWDAATDNIQVTGYEIYRDGVLIQTVSGTSYTDTGLTALTTYVYTVSACDNSGNCSEESTSAQATTLEVDTEAPTVPANLAATAQSSSQIDLIWDAATDNAGVTGYNIYRDSVLIDTVTGTSYSDTGLTPLTIYTYTVSAFDAAGNASAESTQAQAETLEYIEVVEVSHAVATGNDDAEELSSGSVVLNSSDLELSTDLTEQTIGVRFSSVNIPYGAQIVEAYIEFTTDEVTTGATSLVISIEDTSDAAAYEATDSNLSSRVVSATTVAWTDVETWDSVGSTHATPDLSALLQEAVVQPGWAAGNAVSFIITGTGTRTAESYEGSAAGAPRLVVSYTVAPDTSAPSVPANLTATPTSGSTIDLTWDAATDNIQVTGYEIYRDGVLIQTVSGTSYTDTGLTALTTYVYTVSACDNSGNCSEESTSAQATTLEVDTEAPTVPANLAATAQSSSQIDLTWDAATDNAGVTGYNIYRDSVLIDTVTGTSYSDTGLTPLTIYTYTVSAFDAAGNASAESTQAQAETLEYIEVVEVSHAVATGNDDAEELTSGSVVLNSSDLELSTDLTEQTIGVRFSSVNIPYGAQIVDAYIEFTTDEVTTGATSLVISIEDTSDAAAYEATAGNLSSRVVSATTVAWTDVETWDSVSSTHATPDLSALLQEAVVQPGWAAGNAVSFIITGTGTRTAESYEGSAAGAPRLVVSYTVAPDTSAPSVPANLTATPTSGSTIDLTWDAATDNIQVTGYEIYRDGVLIQTVSGTSYTDTGLTALTTYVYTVSACDNSGNCSEESTSAQATTLEVDTEAPTVPANLAATAQSSSQIDLTWDAATDNAGVTGYNIYRDSVLIDTVTGTSYSDTGLTPLTIYTYTVSAFDAAGNESAESTQAQAETLEYIEVVEVSYSVSTGNDDAEELSTGIVELGSSDLELSTDLTEQTIGVRFSSVNIPYGAQIVDAYIEFTTDEVTTGATSLVISIEDTSDAAAYEATDSNLSSRVVSLTTVAWTDVETWDSVGSTHATPDLSALLQEAVSQSGWASGNAVSFIITGTGTRTAESYEGSTGGAPKLVVSYIMP